MRKELSLQHFYQLFKKNALLIIVLPALGMCLSYLAMFHFVTPKYNSQAELFVNQKTEQQIIQFSEVQTSIQLINTYRALITGDSVMNQAAKALGNRYSIYELRDAISIYQPEDSQTFYISAEMNSPTEAQNVVTEVVNAFENIVNQVYSNGEENIHVLSLASYDSTPVSPSLMLYIIGGAAVGFMACIVGILFFDIMDSTVKDLEFFTQEGLLNMGVIYTDELPKEMPAENSLLNMSWLRNGTSGTLDKHSKERVVENLTESKMDVSDKKKDTHHAKDLLRQKELIAVGDTILEAKRENALTEHLPDDISKQEDSPLNIAVDGDAIEKEWEEILNSLLSTKSNLSVEEIEPPNYII